MYFSVYATSIKEKNGGAVVEASNGSPDGPPFVRFEVDHVGARKCVLKKKYILTIEEDKEN